MGKFGVLFSSAMGHSATSIGSVGGTKDSHSREKVKPSQLEEQLERQLAAWRRNSSWVDETPVLEVIKACNPSSLGTKDSWF